MQATPLLINEPPLQVQPALAVAAGLNEAIILQQLHYWLRGTRGKHVDGTRWVYNTLEGWERQFPFWSTDTIKRALTSLRNQGLIRSRHDLNDHPMDRTTWYAIDYEVLAALPISADCTNATGQSAVSITKDNGDTPPIVPPLPGSPILPDSETIQGEDYRPPGAAHAPPSFQNDEQALVQAYVLHPTLETFYPNPEHRQWAIELGVPRNSIGVETEQWRDTHRARGTPIKDVVASWRTWMRNVLKYGTTGGGFKNGNGHALPQVGPQGGALLVPQPSWASPSNRVFWREDGITCYVEGRDMFREVRRDPATGERVE